MKRQLYLAAFLLGVFAGAAGSANASCDPVRGAKLFASKCQLCHTVGKEPKKTVGPNLSGVLGRKVASLPGFRYSPALTKAGGEWTAARLDVWLTNPAKMYPGTAMAFAGLKEADDRADVSCFLSSTGKTAVDDRVHARSNFLDAHNPMPPTMLHLADYVVATAESNPLQRDLAGRLLQIERRWAAGDANGMANELYTDDAMIAGEGQERPTRGKGAIRQLLELLIKDNKAVHIDLSTTLDLGKNAAATWVIWNITPRGSGEPFKMRSLLVWKRSAGVWRILADMYSAGDLHPWRRS